MLVVALYSGFTRLVRHLVEVKKDNRYFVLQAISPPICYAVLYSFLRVYVTVAYAVFSVEAERFIIFGVELALFAAIILYSIAKHGLKVREKIEPEMSLIQLTFHVVFLGALLITGMYLQIPAMVSIAMALLVAEFFLHLLPSHRLVGQDR
jgi:hypothetical protein